ncbi:MAG: M48 family metallopeptidase [Armatimonadota bacterium]|nr:MAG: M48 family metallopeptidase [Armatimonadota bacterium]
MRSLRNPGLLIALACFAVPTWAGAAPVEEEVGVGKAVMSQVRRFGLTADPTLAAVGDGLSEVVNRKDLPWQFWVIEDLASHNAFAAPGGFVFITRNYYEKLSDDETAFVIGHEMAHIDLGHHERQSKRVKEANLGNLLLNILTQRRGAWGTAVDLGSTAYVTHYSRALEKEADLAGYEYAEAAGYDARAAVSALSKLGEEPDLHPWIVNIYATHPLLSSREDRLAALGGEEPEDVPAAKPSAEHTRNLTGGLEPFDPSAPIAVRILAPEGGRWENPWRKNFTKHLHRRLIPLGFEIAGDDLMYKPDIGDPVEAARSRDAKYLLLVTVHEMETTQQGAAGLAGRPMRASIDVGARLVRVEDRSQLWEDHFAEVKEGRDVLPLDPAILYTDTCVGALAERAAGEIAIGCAKAAGAGPAEAGESAHRGKPLSVAR